MASLMQGLGVVFGLVGSHQIGANMAIKAQNLTPVVGAVTLSKFNDGASINVDFTRDRIADEDGVFRTVINHGVVWTAQFEFTPKSTTKALAEGELFIPVHGATLAVSSMKLAALNQTWAITGFTLRFVKAGVAVYTVPCEFSPEADIVTPTS